MLSVRKSNRPYLILFFLFAFPNMWAETDFGLLRERLRENVTLGRLDYDASDPDMRAYIDGIAADAARYESSMRFDTTFLWDDMNLLTGVPQYTPFHVHYSYMRLHTMARAWAYPHSPLYHNYSLLHDIRYGLALLYNIAYNENTPICGNWWEWRIGNTWDYANIVSILYEQLTPEEIHRFDLGGSRHVRQFVKHGNLTFANQADVCRNLMMIGVLTDNEQDIRDAIEYSVPAFVDNTSAEVRAQANLSHDSILREQRRYQHNTIVWKKEGLYEDGTFIQHIAIPYIGTYGMQMISLLAMMQVLFADTDFTIPQPIIDILPVWITKTYLPAIYRGEIMLMFMGRGNARDPYHSARVCALNILDCCPLIEDSLLRNRIERTTRDMIACDKHYSSPYANLAPLPVNKPRVERALQQKGNEDYSDRFSIVLAAGDRLIHETGLFRFSLAMSSNRIGKYEAFVRPTKSENTTGWYTGDGMTYLYTPDDPAQYKQYIPRLNPYRVPGTTVDLLQREPCASGMILFDHSPAAPDIARAGGVMMQGTYSSAMMQLLGARSQLVAKKSWFCFDKEIVCLGADICLSDDREVITTVENRQYTRNMSINGKDIGTPSEQLFRKVQYAYLDRTGGYVFPDKNDVFANVSDRGFNELWISHGKAPQDESYAYILLPKMSEKEVKRYACKPDIVILKNDNEAQAVKHKPSDIIAVNFWKEANVAGVGCDGMAAVMVRAVGDTLYLNVAEPTWLRDSVTMTLNGVYEMAKPAKNVVSIETIGYKTKIIINTHYLMGMTSEIVLHKMR